MLIEDQRKADHLFERFQKDIEIGIKQMTVGELLAWREHAVNNPYCIPGVTERIIEMLNHEIYH